MNEALLNSCSEGVEEKLLRMEEQLVGMHEGEEPLNFRYGPEAYALSKVQSEATEIFIDEYNTDYFWNWDELTDEPHRAWYTFKLLSEYEIDGWQEEEWISEIIEGFREEQSVTGEFNWAEVGGHTNPLGLFVEARPDALSTKHAIDYFVDEPPEIYPAYELPIGISAVCRYDYYGYEERINDLASDLVDLQQEDGFFSHRGRGGTKTRHNTQVTAFAIDALSKVGGYDENIQKAADWLDKEGSDTVYRLLGLLNTPRGPKIPKSVHDWKQELAGQELDQVSPSFTQTAPPLSSSTHTTTIRKEIEALIENTENQLRICSSYIDMLHEDVIDMSVENESVEAKILTKPKGDISGHRARMGKSALEQLNRASNREVRTNHIIHSRLVVSDESRMLVSSADLTRDQLVDEFNAGLATGDKATIDDAIDYFESLWSASDPL